MLAARRMMNMQAVPAVLYASWRADDLSLSDGANVTSWVDAINSITPTAGSGVEPTFKTGILNSLPIVRASVAGKQLFVTLPAALKVDDFTYQAVVYPTTAGAGFGPGRAAFSLGPDSSHDGAGIAVDSSSQAVGFAWLDSAAGGSILNGWHYITVRRNSVAGTLIVRVDGTQVASNSSLSALTWGTGLSIFDDQRSYPNTSWVGDIAQIDLYLGAMPNSQIATAEAALASKWGLQVGTSLAVARGDSSNARTLSTNTTPTADPTGVLRALT